MKVHSQFWKDGSKCNNQFLLIPPCKRTFEQLHHKQMANQIFFLKAKYFPKRWNDRVYNPNGRNQKLEMGFEEEKR